MNIKEFYTQVDIDEYCQSTELHEVCNHPNEDNFTIHDSDIILFPESNNREELKF